MFKQLYETFASFLSPICSDQCGSENDSYGPKSQFCFEIAKSSVRCNRSAPFLAIQSQLRVGIALMHHHGRYRWRCHICAEHFFFCVYCFAAWNSCNVCSEVHVSPIMLGSGIKFDGDLEANTNSHMPAYANLRRLAPAHSANLAPHIFSSHSKQGLSSSPLRLCGCRKATHDVCAWCQYEREYAYKRICVCGYMFDLCEI